ncbi:MAG TPA: GTP-binding protein [Planctomycetia bacterium]|nr:GTP-binding protein [Planctomycetia bacterium]
MSPLTLYVVSGFAQSAKAKVLDSLRRAHADRRVATITNANLAAGENADPENGDEIAESDQGCSCCSLRDELWSEVARLAGEDAADVALIEAGPAASPKAIAENLLATDEHGEGLGDSIRIAGFITVVDAATFAEDFASTEELSERGFADPEGDRDVVGALTDQIEFANLIAIDAEGPGEEKAAGTERLAKLLNPGATIVRLEAGGLPKNALTPATPFDFGATLTDAGWLRRIQEEENDATGFVFRARRPFHPARLAATLESNAFRSVQRSHGLAWLATRPDLAGEWSSAGNVVSLGASGYWLAATPEDEWPEGFTRAELQWDAEWGDRTQEIAFLGLELDEATVRRALDGCLLNDAEMAAGSDSWESFEDPFPAWLPGDEAEQPG